MKKILYKNTNKNEKEKKCMKCDCACWRSDVDYCWVCYKYEMFESR